MTEQGQRELNGRGGRSAARPTGVSLLEVEPELEPLLDGEELEQARRFALPSVTLNAGKSVTAVLQATPAFGAVVLDGLLLAGVQIGSRRSLRLLGAGEVIPTQTSDPPTPLSTVTVRTAMRSRIALLDDHFLTAAHRWPRLASLSYRRAIDSSERLATQLAISQLPRVDERLMALMWLLAEDWGHVTPAGIRLRLPLTHEALGELVGAQRPTVTLALKELAARGSLIKQDRDWTILDPPPEPQATQLKPAYVLEARPKQAARRTPPAESAAGEGRLAVLRAELARVREEYGSERALAQNLRDETRQLRARALELRDDARALTEPTESSIPALGGRSPD
ncbi:MAG TPA: Crp/Fnr family transcriptional regulator [Solirubrobacteraceae bacterium]|nr:Crp/Fnr family transcriptional regulator [Solirubrobacteraceae bacterium]